MTSYAILDDLATDPAPVPAAKMAAIYTAIRDAAETGNGRFSAATVRPMLPAYLTDDPRVGAAVSALAKTGVIEWTGQYVRSGNAKSRNSNRPVPVYQVADWAALERRAA